MVSNRSVRLWFTGGQLIYGSVAEIESNNYCSRQICCVFLVICPFKECVAHLSTCVFRGDSGSDARGRYAPEPQQAHDAHRGQYAVETEHQDPCRLRTG